jgi:hypothetical protein
MTAPPSHNALVRDDDRHLRQSFPRSEPSGPIVKESVAVFVILFQEVRLFFRDPFLCRASSLSLDCCETNVCVF